MRYRPNPAGSSLGYMNTNSRNWLPIEGWLLPSPDPLDHLFLPTWCLLMWNDGLALSDKIDPVHIA